MIPFYSSEVRAVRAFDDVIAHLSGCSAGGALPFAGPPPSMSSPAAPSTGAAAPPLGLKATIRAELEATLDEINGLLKRGGLAAAARAQFIQKRVAVLAALERIAREAPIHEHPDFELTYGARDEAGVVAFERAFRRLIGRAPVHEEVEAYERDRDEITAQLRAGRSS